MRLQCYCFALIITYRPNKNNVGLYLQFRFYLLWILEFGKALFYVLTLT